MKKVLILHVSNTFNYGSMMMAENLISEIIKKSNEELEIFVDASLEKDINRLKLATEYEKIYTDKFLVSFKNMSKTKRILERTVFLKRRNKKISNYYDLIIYLGGDDFSEFYIKGFIGKINAVIDILSIKYLNESKKNVILLGQTIGPYTGFRKYLAKKIFSKIKIYTRDDINLKVMKDNYDVEAIYSRDLAFLDLHLQNSYDSKYKEILDKYDLKDNEYVILVGTEFLSHYCSDENIFLDGFIDIIRAIKNKYKSKKIVWLSHVTSFPPHLSDNYLLELLNKRYDKYIDKNLIVINERILPVEARIILGYGYLTITCRMHAAISTFQMGKPAICLSYSPKYRGVIADGLDMNELVIEAKNDELWENEISNLIINKTDYIDENYKQLQEKIKLNVDKCKNIVNDTLNEIIKKLDCKKE